MNPAFARKRAEAWLDRQFSRPKTDSRRVVVRVLRSPELAAYLIEGVGSRNPAVRFGSAKALALVGEANPGIVYPHFGFLLELLSSPNSILRWNAERALASLAAVDRENRIDAVLDRYLAPISGPNLIDAGNVIESASRIAIAKPDLAGRIAAGILRVGDARYKTPECRNVAIGHAIESLGRFMPLIPDKAAVMGFVRAQLENPRASTRRKAETFLRRHAAAVSAC